MLRNSYGTKMISLTDHRMLRTCMADLGWFQRKQKQAFSNPRQQLTSNARELEEVTTFIHTYTSWAAHEGNAYKVSNTSWMFNTNHGEGSSVADGLNNNSSRFPWRWNSIIMWTSDSVGQTQRCNGVCSRNQPRVRQHYEHRWFWFDLILTHTQIKIWLRW